MRISKSFQTNKTLEHIFKRVGMDLIWNRGGLRGIASSLSLCHWQRRRESSLISAGQEDAIRGDLKRSAYKECALFILKTCQTVAGHKISQFYDFFSNIHFENLSKCCRPLVWSVNFTSFFKYSFWKLVKLLKYDQSILRVFFNLISLEVPLACGGAVGSRTGGEHGREVDCWPPGLRESGPSSEWIEWLRVCRNSAFDEARPLPSEEGSWPFAIWQTWKSEFSLFPFFTGWLTAAVPECWLLLDSLNLVDKRYCKS